jgi:hypothetical protein
MDNVEKIKAIIDKQHAISEGKCGIPIPVIQNESEMDIEPLNVILRQLYNEKYFILRNGLNGKLIFKKI